MKKLLVLIMVAGLLVGALSVESSAKKRKKKAKPVKVVRTETAEYSGPGYLRVATSTGAVCFESVINNCTVFPARASEKYVTVEVTDNSGTPSPVSVSLGDSSTIYCGKTTAPVALTGFTEVGVHVGIEAPPTCQGVTTAGQVKVTFSNLP